MSSKLLSCRHTVIDCPVDDICQMEVDATCTESTRCYEFHVTDKYGNVRFTAGCVGRPGEVTLQYQCGKPSPNKENAGRYFSRCCMNHDYCNNHTIDDFVRLHQPEHHKQTGLQLNPGSGVFIAPSIVLLILVGAFIFYRKRNTITRLRRNNRTTIDEEGHHHLRDVQEMTPLPVSNNHDFHNNVHHIHTTHTSSFPLESTGPLKNVPVGDSTLEDLGGFSPDCFTSGSGSGGQQLAQKTLARDITLLEGEIGTGRYGVVKKGVYQGDIVAVKIIRSVEESSWKRECDFYELPTISNKFILGFIGADLASLNSVTSFWIVTEYHEEGSLYDYLLRTEMPLSHALSIAYSATKGLEHLHIETTGTLIKPRIAHRDLKSKNLLIKRRLGFGRQREEVVPSVCIADFGLSVWESCPSIVNESLRNPRVGTKRYMAGEVLSFNPDSLTGLDANFSRFECFIRADVYAFALILWETFRRVEFQEDNKVVIHAEDYQIPYEKEVPNDPSFDEMKKVVVTDGCRPSFPDSWTENQVMQDVKQLIRESWSSNPSARITIALIKIKLQKIMKLLRITPNE